MVLQESCSAKATFSRQEMRGKTRLFFKKTKKKLKNQQEEELGDAGRGLYLAKMLPNQA